MKIHTVASRETPRASVSIIKIKSNPPRGQRPNESQKVVIIDMIKSVGEIASKIWPVV